MQFCGREECIYKAIESMIEKMKEEIKKTQNIEYEEQLVVAQIYYVTAAILAEACRRNFRVRHEECEPSSKFEKNKISLDVFIMLNQLQEDGLISEEYKNQLVDALVKIKPSLKSTVEEDRNKGLI